MIRQGHIKQKSCSKKIGLMLVHSTHIPHIHLTLHQVISIFFLFCTKCFEWQEIFWRRSGENVCRKPTEFYLRGINILLNKWQEVIQNNGNEINSFLHYSWISYILLKWKLFMTQPYTFIHWDIYIYIYTYPYTYILGIPKV